MDISICLKIVDVDEILFLGTQCIMLSWSMAGLAEGMDPNLHLPEGCGWPQHNKTTPSSLVMSTSSV